MLFKATQYYTAFITTARDLHIYDGYRDNILSLFYCIFPVESGK